MSGQRKSRTTPRFLFWQLCGRRWCHFLKSEGGESSMGSWMLTLTCVSDAEMSLRRGKWGSGSHRQGDGACSRDRVRSVRGERDKGSALGLPKFENPGKESRSARESGRRRPRAVSATLWKAFLKGWWEHTRVLPAPRRPLQSPALTPGPARCDSPTLHRSGSAFKFLSPRHYRVAVLILNLT